MKRQLIVVSSVVALVSGIMLAREIPRWLDRRDYNEAIAQARYDEAAAHGGDYGVFAAAFNAHTEGRYQDARVIYTRLEKTNDPGLRSAVLFNMGNTYLQQASAIDLEADSDLALPLLELAKASYRETLHVDPGHWGARYNLERTLELSPDVQEHRLMEIQGRRGAVRTIISRDPDDNLP